MPEFSIIVPIYKVEKYLEICIDSIIGQSFCNFELILVDDGSPDTCGEICDRYSSSDTRVKVVHKENGGLSSARNAGLDIATGKYVIFIDSDDFWDDASALEHIHINLIAVIGIHITMTQPNNYSVQEIGKSNYTILTCVYTLIQWAVPVFLMISGNLLLHSNKLSFTKVKKMSLRMGAVLLLFGSAFALLEQVFERKTLEIGMLPNSVLMTLQQKSWSHLWYLYILIGIYLILIPLKRFIDNSSNREICIFTAILIFGNFVVPTINIAFGTKIENYMLFTQYVTYVLLGYIIGGLHAEDNGREKKAIDTITNRGGIWLELWLFVSIIKIIVQYANVIRCGEGSALILGDRIFTMIQALSVFCLFKKYMDGVHVGKLAKSISRCSFGIYLIHPFFINLLYKMMNITPTNFPLLGIGFAIPLLWLLVFILSWGGTFIMLKVPVLNKLL